MMSSRRYDRFRFSSRPWPRLRLARAISITRRDLLRIRFRILLVVVLTTEFNAPSFASELERHRQQTAIGRIMDVGFHDRRIDSESASTDDLLFMRDSDQSRTVTLFQTVASEH